MLKQMAHVWPQSSKVAVLNMKGKKLIVNISSKFDGDKWQSLLRAKSFTGIVPNILLRQVVMKTATN